MYKLSTGISDKQKAYIQQQSIKYDISFAEALRRILDREMELDLSLNEIKKLKILLGKE